MPTPETLLTFFSLSLLLALSPGPDNVFVLVQSARHGTRAGLAVVVGLCLGLVVHTAAVALGLAAVFASSPMAFTVLKYCGAAYLAWLAWQAWRAPVTQVDAAAPQPGAAQSSAALDARALRRMVARGVVMNLTNPKVLIFFLAFLPQFADPARGSLAPQIMALGCVFMLAALLVFGAVACFSGAFGRLLQRSASGQRWLNRLTALVFVGLALRLASLQR
ncbi:MAG: LysE family translocator [Comamonas sp.]